MPARILLPPLPVTGRALDEHQALAARAEELAIETGATIHAVALTGDLAGQHAVERELAREGLDRDGIGREEFVARVRALEAASLEAAATALGGVLRSGLEADGFATAARTAFVALYEQGLITADERVVATCGRCQTVVDEADSETGEVDGELLHIRAVADNGDHVVIEVLAAELLPGAVAIAVPDTWPAAGGMADVPLAGRIPLIPAPVGAPVPVVPAHDAGAAQLARGHGLGVVRVLDDDGVVRLPGCPIDGLPRYAARAAARDLIVADGQLVDAVPVAEIVQRCGRCGSVLLPVLGRHWFLPMGDLEIGAADAVREGVVAVEPLDAWEEVVKRAGLGHDWCVSHQVVAGIRVPLATCLDCGREAVTFEEEGPCPSCMGTLVPDPSVLDARFVGSVWPIAVAGWPGDDRGVAAASAVSTLLVGSGPMATWVLPMLALGLRLTGAAPFATVVRVTT